MGQPGPLIHLNLVNSNKQYNFYNKSIRKNVHPVYSAGIQTHNLSNFIRHPQPLDQGACPLTSYYEDEDVRIKCSVLQLK